MLGLLFFVSKVSAIHFHYIQKKADLSQTGQLLRQNNLQLMIEPHYGPNEKIKAKLIHQPILIDDWFLCDKE